MRIEAFGCFDANVDFETDDVEGRKNSSSSSSVLISVASESFGSFNASDVAEEIILKVAIPILNKKIYRSKLEDRNNKYFNKALLISF